jgi:hypothetical protein
MFWFGVLVGAGVTLVVVLVVGLFDAFGGGY